VTPRPNDETLAAAAKVHTPTTLPIGTPSVAPLARGLPSAPGTAIGRFTVQRLLGTGGMGHVYEAHDQELDRPVALKVLRPERTAETLTERLLRESRLTAKIAHPAVMTVYDVGRAGDKVFIAMELIRGETLGAYVARTKPPWREIVRLYERAAEGLAAAHAIGIVHRDFKPDNVLVEGEARRIVVTDFGIARAIDDNEDAGGERPAIGGMQLTTTGTAIGTPAYMAPEQLLGERIDPRADVFAFAVSLWEALFGQRPFDATSLDAIRAATMSPPVPTRAVPRRLLRALRRGLELVRTRRWPDMPSFARELTAIRRGGRKWKLAGGGAALVSASIAAAFMLRPHPANPCASFAVAYDHAALAKVLASAPTVLATLDKRANGLRATHDKTCHADRKPAQDPRVAACLAARKLELEGTAADLILDGSAHAEPLATVVEDGTRCAAPPAFALFALVPSDPTLRRKVTALRYRGWDIEDARDRGEIERALAQATALAHDAEPVWPPVYAEASFLLGTVQSLHGDNKLAIVTLKQAAAVAESAHLDDLAEHVWVYLGYDAGERGGNADRELEYLAYADAALDRMGHPAAAQAWFDYEKGSALLRANRVGEADKLMHEAVDLSKREAPAYLTTALIGLGSVYERENRIAEAIAAYRQVLSSLRPDADFQVTMSARTALAEDLSQAGEHHEAIATAREVAALADKTLAATDTSRCVTHGLLTETLSNAHQYADALVEAETSVACMKEALGERSEPYAETLKTEAEVLSAMGQHAVAVQKLERACDVIAFEVGEASLPHARCWLSEVTPLMSLGRNREALALDNQAIPVIRSAIGDDDILTATAFGMRGKVEGKLGQIDQAAADLEHALAMFAKITVDPGVVADVQASLAEALWRKDPKRAHELIATALHTFDATPEWSDVRAQTAQWLASDGHPKPKH
jgi:tetratricopeptide (TPR) repeat protein/predicted Ser/Thr protein kinase